jgi:alpha-1,6-mannosyltransferase
MTRSSKWLLAILGISLIAIDVGALKLGDLRTYTVEFEWLFFLAFAVYGVACFICLQANVDAVDQRILFAIFAIAAVMQAVLISSRPTLTDDMYRYVWDGRVQARGISPYRYPPNAPELTSLRDQDIYPSINRKPAVTVYPPAAEAAFLILWKIMPDNVHWFQLAMAAGGLLAGILLMGLLKDLGYSPLRALIFLWSPLLVFETAHAAHIDGLVLPLLVGAWWARVRNQDALTGFLLGIAAAMKFYPALLLPFLWRPQHRKGRWTMLLAFACTVGMLYLPYILTSETSVLGYLPHYFKETFNISPLVSLLNSFLDSVGLNIPYRLTALTMGAILVAAIGCVLYPAPDGETALRRCILPIGIVTLFSQDLFAWYLLWLLPLTAIFLQPSSIKLKMLTFPKVDTWFGWWLFCGLVALSYTFFIQWTPVYAAIQFEFMPLYVILFANLTISLWKKFARASKPASIQQSPN